MPLSSLRRGSETRAVSSTSGVRRRVRDSVVRWLRWLPWCGWLAPSRADCVIWSCSDLRIVFASVRLGQGLGQDLSNCSASSASGDGVSCALSVRLRRQAWVKAGATFFDRLFKRLKHLRFCGVALFRAGFSLCLDGTLENRDRDAQKDEARRSTIAIANRGGIDGIPRHNDCHGESGVPGSKWLNVIPMCVSAFPDRRESRS